MPTPPTTALRQASELLGRPAQYLASGATCWVFGDARGGRVLRVERAEIQRGSEGARFAVDAQIREALRAAGVPTPAVKQVGQLGNGLAYCLEEWAQGEGSAPDKPGWHDLGAALQILHALPHRGYGLLENRRDALVGPADTPAAGITTRLKRVWPYDGTSLDTHPLIWAAPGLRSAFCALEHDLGGLTDRPSAVCHTDLHANQLLWTGGRLSALLDFGDCTSGPAAWDWASLAYFHGWEVADLVAGAAGDGAGRDAALFGLLLAQHRAGRAADQGQPDRVAEAVAFAQCCLARLERYR